MFKLNYLLDRQANSLTELWNVNLFNKFCKWEMPEQIFDHIAVEMLYNKQTHAYTHSVTTAFKCRVSCRLLSIAHCTSAYLSLNLWLSGCPYVRLSVCVPTSWPLTGRQLKQRALAVCQLAAMSLLCLLLAKNASSKWLNVFVVLVVAPSLV